MQSRTLLLALLVVACAPEIPEGRATCTTNGDCPTTWVCRRDDRGGRCWRTASADDANVLDANVLDASTLDADLVDMGVHDAGMIDAPAMDAPDTGSGCNAAACAWQFCSDATTCDLPASLTLGDAHTCVLTVAGRIWCWGRNDHGQVGTGASGAAVMSPRLVTAVSAHALQVAAGSAHTCALESRGVVCWGTNADGEIGNGMTGDGDHLVPSVVPSSTTVTDIATGDRHSCSYDGTTLRCWGANEHGQLGTGDLVNRPVPTTVGVMAIMRPDVAGGRHNCYRTTNGSAILCWGANASGQIGDGSTTTAMSPTAVMFPQMDASQLGLGDAHTCVWRTAGHRYMCWGDNASGQLGNASTTDAHTPVAVSIATGLAPGTSAVGLFVAGGDSHTCAVDEAHHVWCWGANASGQLGIGNNTPHTEPISSLLVPGVDTMRAGASHTCAIAAGQLWCWGENADSQIGNGMTADALTPVRITP